MADGFVFGGFQVEIGPGGVGNAVSDGFVLSFLHHHADTRIETLRRQGRKENNDAIDWSYWTAPRRRGGTEKNGGSGFQLPVASFRFLSSQFSGYT